MPTSVALPALGESVTEGTISRWLKRVGDHVNAGEPIVEVSTDKVDSEIPSPVSGIVLEIRFEEDAVAEVGAVLAVVISDTELRPVEPEVTAVPPQFGSAPTPAPAPVSSFGFGSLTMETHSFSVDEAMAAVDRALGAIDEPAAAKPVAATPAPAAPAVPTAPATPAPTAPAVPTAPAGFSMPEFTVPDFNAPDFLAREFPTRAAEADPPTIELPTFPSFSTDVPAPTAPATAVPEPVAFSGPGLATPALQVPEIELPDFRIPDFRMPDVADVSDSEPGTGTGTSEPVSLGDSDGELVLTLPAFPSTEIEGEVSFDVPPARAVTPLVVPEVGSTSVRTPAAPVVTPAAPTFAPVPGPVFTPVPEPVGTPDASVDSATGFASIAEPVRTPIPETVFTPVPEPVRTPDTSADSATLGPVAASGFAAVPPAVPAVPDEADERAAEPYLTPAMRRFAAEAGVDLAGLDGSGVGGRLRKQDVLDAAEETRLAEEARAIQAAREAEEARLAEEALAAVREAEALREHDAAAEAAAALEAELAREAVEVVTAPRPAPSLPESAKRGTTEHLSRLRGTMARRMVESLQTSPHATATIEVDLTDVTKLRASVKDSFRTSHGIRLNFLPFIAVAVADALRRYPKLNALLDTATGTIAYAADECLGIAVDTEHGSITPVVKHAGKLDVTAMARAIADLVDRTHSSQITPDDLVDGTFTITNYGATGTLFDTPIINQPQVAILGVGALARRPMVVDDPIAGQQIAIREMVYLSLSYDRRLVDAVDAARFLGHVKSRLERADFAVKA